MIVVFVSESEKGAIKTTRTILDSFATRIGSNTWKTRITMDGLNAVEALLRKYASKSMAVACHRLATHYNTELMWIVGNKSKFNQEGICPTNYTSIDHLQDCENSWHLLQHIKILTALSSLFHDLGKASILFQNKLEGKKVEADPIRHEWVTCCILKHFIGTAESDEVWLNKLINENISLPASNKIEPIDKPLNNLPPIAAMLMWLIVSHHRLPAKSMKDSEQLRLDPCETPKQMLNRLTSDYNYSNEKSTKDKNNCFSFPKGLPVNNPQWQKLVKKWASKALEKTEDFKVIYNESSGNGKIRTILHFARLSLMLGDHYFSSKEHDDSWKNSDKLIANTKSNSKSGQFLDEHLVGVCEQALKIAHALPRLEEDMPWAENVKSLRRRSGGRFAWQDKAIDELKEAQSELEKNNEKTGFFALNMASTGCGKTIANAKIMRLLSKDHDSLRYILALGLRTLTLQTGDAYREKIGLDKSKLGVIIGSKAVQDLYEKDKIRDEEENIEKHGSESLEDIFQDTITYEDNSYNNDFLEAALPTPKHRQLLYAPVLVCTIDHLMGAVESIKGGHHILPCLRLMSSDLVIDEIDDFSGKDLIAISRLVYLAGMMGRKVMLSSATIPPDLAFGLFNAYQHGYKLFCESRNIEQTKICCAWIDEFKTETDTLNLNNISQTLNDYKDLHKKFIDCRSKKILESIKLRHGYISALEKAPIKDYENTYFEKIKENILNLHSKNCYICNIGERKIKVSCGVVRMANITPCAELGKYLIKADYGNDTLVKAMIYHSQQILLMRHVQEKFLDEVLNRQSGKKFYDNEKIKKDLEQLPQNITNIIYVVVATPVEEIGRDHDFDWAVIEPSSVRSIIQMAGRIRRHRCNEEYSEDNIAVMQYNYKGFEYLVQGKDEKCFLRPGYEESCALKSHNVSDLVDEEKDLKGGITSIPRITKPESLKEKEKLADLEHYAMENGVGDCKNVGPDNPLGWITQFWWLTGIPQILNKFRQGSKTETYYLMPEDKEDSATEFKFKQKIEEYGEEARYEAVEALKNIRHVNFEHDNKRIWFDRNYYKILTESDYSIEGDAEKTAEEYGFIDVNIYDDDNEEKFEYNPIYGLIKVKK